jgi:hypothetical protein
MDPYGKQRLVEEGTSVDRVRGADRLPKRRFEYVPLWAIPVFMLYALRRVDCARCGVTAKQVPWCEGKHAQCTTYRWFLARWARRLSWLEDGRKRGSSDLVEWRTEVREKSKTKGKKRQEDGASHSIERRKRRKENPRLAPSTLPALVPFVMPIPHLGTHEGFLGWEAKRGRVTLLAAHNEQWPPLHATVRRRIPEDEPLMTMRGSAISKRPSGAGVLQVEVNAKDAVIRTVAAKALRQDYCLRSMPTRQSRIVPS